MYIVTLAWISEAKGGIVKTEQRVLGTTKKQDKAISYMNNWLKNHMGARIYKNSDENRPDEIGEIPPYCEHSTLYTIAYEEAYCNARQYGFSINIHYTPDKKKTITTYKALSIHDVKSSDLDGKIVTETNRIAEYNNLPDTLKAVIDWASENGWGNYMKTYEYYPKGNSVCAFIIDDPNVDSDFQCHVNIVKKQVED